jgi:glycosyltransferase involved in cell wall biosynthesis
VSASRLLFVVNDAAFFISHRLPLAIAARRAGYDVHVATAQAPVERAITEAGLTLHHVPFTRSGTGLFTELRAAGILARLQRWLRPDLVHHVTSKAILYGWLALRAVQGRKPAVVNAVTGLGYVFTDDNARVMVGRRALLRWYRLALSAERSLTIFQNHDDLALLAGGREEVMARCSIIPGAGVDVNVFAQRPEPPGPPVVVFPGRMLRHKGVQEFVSAARSLRSRGVNARFVLVGGADFGNPTAVSEATLREWTSDGAVEWWGERSDMPGVLAQSAIVALPSYREGAPKSLLEAAAVGRPIVTSDVPGCRTVVRHGHNGLLVPPRDAAALATAITELLDSPDERRRMGSAGRALAEAEWADTHVINATLAMYQRALAL